jgi:hypothetical protein
VHKKVLWESLKEKDHYEELGVVGRIILKWSCNTRLDGVV